MNDSKQTVAWLFGRGASMSCGLDWSEPKNWKDLDRNERTNKVTITINQEEIMIWG